MDDSKFRAIMATLDLYEDEAVAGAICKLDTEATLSIEDVLRLEVFKRPVIMDALLSKGIFDVNARHNSTGATLLHFAARRGLLDLMKRLLDAGADMLQQSCTLWTPLLAAVRFSNKSSSVEAVKLLLKYGADPNCAENYGRTPLMIALLYSDSDAHPDVVPLLLDAGADIDRVDNDGWSALTFAGRSIPLFSLLLQRGGNLSQCVSPLLAAAECSLEATKFLVEEMRCDVNTKDSVGVTPLHFAAAFSNIEGSIDIVRYLLDMGADVTLTATSSSNTALIETIIHLKYQRSTWEVVKLLMERGSDYSDALLHAPDNSIAKKLLELGVPAQPSDDNDFPCEKHYRHIHLKAVHAQLCQEMLLISACRPTPVIKKRCRIDDEVPEITAPTYNLHAVPYAKLMDAITLYIDGKYPQTHPLAGRVEGTPLLPCESLKGKLYKLRDKIALQLRIVANILHLQTQTKSGRKRLKREIRGAAGIVD